VAEPGSDRLKVHRRAIALDGHTYTVLSPRPTLACRFATNSFQGAWHVVTDVSGARLLGRLLWAMAFQSRARTIAVIDPSLLVSNPFDADPSLPITILNDDLGALSRPEADDLCAQLPYSTVPAGTVVLQTRGLDAAVSDDSAAERRLTPTDTEHRIEGAPACGLVVMAAPPPILRAWGLRVSQLGIGFDEGSDEAVLDWSGSSGEIQVLEDFDDRVVRAREAREHLFPGRGGEALGEDERRRVWELTRGR